MNVLRPVVGLLVGTVIACVIVEGGVRVLRPSPRMQLIRLNAEGLSFDVSGDVPLWWDTADGALVRHDDCLDDADHILLLVGDSIFAAGGGGGHHGRVAGKLQDALDAAGDSVCVVDVSVPGFAPEQMLAAAKKAFEQTDADLALYLVWKSDVPFIRLADTLYSRHYVPDAQGFPPPPIAVPLWVHHALFKHARVWEYATLASIGAGADPTTEAAGGYLEALDWMESVGLEVDFVEATELTTSFDVLLQERLKPYAADDPSRPRGFWMHELQQVVTQRGHRYLLLAELLKDHDAMAIRLDACCHYNEAGHQAMADAFVPVVQQLVAQRDER